MEGEPASRINVTMLPLRFIAVAQEGAGEQLIKYKRLLRLDSTWWYSSAHRQCLKVICKDRNEFIPWQQQYLLPRYWYRVENTCGASGSESFIHELTFPTADGLTLVDISKKNSKITGRETEFGNSEKFNTLIGGGIWYLIYAVEYFIHCLKWINNVNYVPFLSPRFYLHHFWIKITTGNYKDGIMYELSTYWRRTTTIGHEAKMSCLIKLHFTYYHYHIYRRGPPIPANKSFPKTIMMLL